MGEDLRGGVDGVVWHEGKHMKSKVAMAAWQQYNVGGGDVAFKDPG